MKHKPGRELQPGEIIPGTDELFSALGDQLAQLRGVIHTANAVRLRGTARAFPFTASQRIAMSAGRLHGFSLRETTGAASAIVRLHDGFDANGDLIATVSLIAAESVRDWFEGGLAFGAGLYAEIVSGAVEGAIYLGTGQ